MNAKAREQPIGHQRAYNADRGVDSPHNLAVLRHMALNVMQKDGQKGSLRGKFKRAGWDEAYLARLLTLF